MTAEPRYSARIDLHRAMTFDDRALAEAVRAAEAGGDASFNDHEVAGALRRDPADVPLEHRICARARALAEGTEFPHALREVRTSLAWLCFAGVCAAFVAGALIARSAMADRVANILALLIGLLGVQTLMLLAWIIGMVVFARSGSSGGMLGRAIMRTWRWVVARSSRTAAHTAAAEATARIYAARPMARWTLSSITHGLWTAANLGMLAALALMFLGEGYRFRWDSTWMSNTAYTRMVTTLATGPQAVGFAVPDEAAIADSRQPLTQAANENAEIARQWSWFFFGSVIVYGLLPRGALLLVSIIGQRAARRAYRLNLDAPDFAALRPRLVPPIRPIETASSRAAHSAASAGISAGPTADGDTAAHRPVGAPAIVGIELAAPETGWPPRVGEVDIVDLGIVDGRDDQHRVLEQLATAPTKPSVLMMVCEFAASPDRGMERLLRDLFNASSAARCVVALTAGRIYAERTDAGGVEQRLEDWRALAARIEADDEKMHVVELDFDHLTDSTRDRLKSLLQGRSASTNHVRRIDSALACIQSHATEWNSDIDTRAQVALHREIASLYQHTPAAFAGMFGVPVNARTLRALADRPDEAAAKLADAATHFTRMLPASLRAQPKWLAAGALAGAVGCIGAAAAFSPIAIAALPTWSLLGAGVSSAISTFLKRSAPNRSSDNVTNAGQSFAETIRAAVLFALVLELQGRPEAAMSRIIDRTVTEGAALEHVTPHTLDSAMKAVIHQFDMACAAEVAS